MVVKWQRLVTDSGETCERCGATGEEFRKAVTTLRECLAPLGIDIAAEEEALSAEEFAVETIESNRITIEGRSLEDWLGAETGQSECESCCDAVGENVECRTVNVEGSIYEAIPAELIVRAGLLAASRLVGAPEPAVCCPDTPEPCDADAPCCPASESEEKETRTSGI
ncbi:MAG: DUF2703 domain-containing protein [Candidatus Eisenbacteria bacterium]|nr:DUF2703 domain-containing protein [Candidatus Eisenbacteria bacterium]